MCIIMICDEFVDGINTDMKIYVLYTNEVHI